MKTEPLTGKLIETFNFLFPPRKLKNKTGLCSVLRSQEKTVNKSSNKETGLTPAIAFYLLSLYSILEFYQGRISFHKSHKIEANW